MTDLSPQENRNNRAVSNNSSRSNSPIQIFELRYPKGKMSESRGGRLSGEGREISRTIHLEDLGRDESNINETPRGYIETKDPLASQLSPLRMSSQSRQDLPQLRETAMTEAYVKPKIEERDSTGQIYHDVYRCQVCNVQLSTDDFLLDVGEAFYRFAALTNITINSEITADRINNVDTKIPILCISCMNTVGCKVNNDWVLDNTICLEVKRRLVIHLYSMKNPELETMISVLNQIRKEFKMPLKIEYHTFGLLKSKLRGYQVQDSADLIILHHKHEGRLFLTDRNGFYNDFLPSAYQKSNGHLLVILTNSDLPDDDSLSNSQIVTLATKGDQPTIGKFNEMGKVYTWKKVCSPLQRESLRKAMSNAYLRNGVASTDELPAEYQLKYPKRKDRTHVKDGKAFKCTLL